MIVTDASIAVATESPARALQTRLSDSLHRTESPRWSRRATTTFVIGVCGTFWVVVGALAAAALH
jgi:hypothetical protein